MYIVPAPASITISSIPVQPMPADTVTLTCTVELNPAVDVPVTVNTVWTGPAGFSTTNTAQAMAGSTTTYTSTAMVSSFGRDESGNYSCVGNVSSTSQFLFDSDEQITTSRVTVGKTIIWTIK